MVKLNALAHLKLVGRNQHLLTYCLIFCLKHLIYALFKSDYKEYIMQYINYWHFNFTKIQISSKQIALSKFTSARHKYELY
jgi:hypothetical protein